MTTMNISPIFSDMKRPVQILGPCSAETEEQVLQTAKELHDLGVHVDYFRSGIWKPRTRPNSFEGVGAPGLQWLKKVRDLYGYKICTEVANTGHVFSALKADVDLLWIGARTTVNPFSVQEIADALEGVDKPVLIKNPINPDLKLWMGAIERIYNAGIQRIAVIHRGFAKFGNQLYRNVPRWQIPIELKQAFPDIEIICDASHICGNRELLFEVSQYALNMDFDGVMLETHCNPDEAWSDAKQQVTPAHLKEQILDRLIVRNKGEDNPEFLDKIEDLRAQIDHIDEELFHLITSRMKVAEQIGAYKKRNNIAILQSHRWHEVVEQAMEKAGPSGLSKEFVSRVLKAIHDESILHQQRILND